MHGIAEFEVENVGTTQNPNVCQKIQRGWARKHPFCQWDNLIRDLVLPMMREITCAWSALTGIQCLNLIELHVRWPSPGAYVPAQPTPCTSIHKPTAWWGFRTN